MNECDKAPGGSTQLRRPKIRRARSAPSHRQPPPSQPLQVSGFRLHRDIESEFQSELGKSLFNRSVELHESSPIKLTVTSLSTQNAESQSAKSQKHQFCCRRQCDSSTHFHDKRRCVNIRSTQCKSPLVADDKNFGSYFHKGRLDVVSVAKTRGSVNLPVPNIGKYLRQVKSANVDSLKSFSLRDTYFDGSVEGLRDRYWRNKVSELHEAKRLNAVEGFCRGIIDILYHGPVCDQIFLIDRRNHLLKVKAVLDKQTEDWFNRIKEEARRESEEREAARKLTEEELKKSKKRKSKKKKRPRSILKNRLPLIVRSDTDSDGASLKCFRESKSVTFREKLTDTRIIRPKSSGKKQTKKKHLGDGDSAVGNDKITSKTKKNRAKSQEGRILSPKSGKSSKKARTFPGHASSEKVLRKKKSKSEQCSAVKTADVEVSLNTPTTNDTDDKENKTIQQHDSNNNSEQSTPLQELETTIATEPPIICPAEEYRTKNEMVVDWLQNKYCSAAPKTLPLI